MNPNGRQSILLIDDEEGFRDVLAKSLVKHGFETLQAADGKEGLRRAAESLPDLILCDLLMPQMSGYEVLAALRGEERLAGIPVIFLTGQSEPAEVRQGMNLGADDYLIKPANILDLLGAIKARLERRHSERQRQEQQMERAMRLFAETVHDLRNPLFAVLGYTNLLKSAAGPMDPSQVRAEKIFDGMQQAVARMQDIISETMFVVRSQMKHLPLTLAAFDLRDFCELLLADHEPCGRLQFHCDDGPFPMVADGPRLRHALENLLSNSLKYSDKSVVVSLTCAVQGYRIEIRDQGIGIPAEDQASIFEPFFRASNTGGRPGHGLGLSVAKSCVEEHGGSIQFVSQPNQGTSFSIELPACPPGHVERRRDAADVRMPAEPLPKPTTRPRASGNTAVSVTKMEVSLKGINTHPQAEPPPPAGRRAAKTHPFADIPQTTGKLRALLVEDDPVVRHVLRELLTSSNEVQLLGEADTVAQARLLARQQTPAVVFLDVNLPDGSGFDVLPGLEPNVAVVFVTSADEYAAQAFDCEAADYLVKPVSSERLQKALLRVRQRLAAKTLAVPLADSRLTGSFLVKTFTEKRLVKFCEIKSILAYGEYSRVYWDQNNQGALLRKSLKQWRAELPEEQFMRVHRRAIINLAFLDRVERLAAGRLQIHLRDTPEPILVSLSQTSALNRKLKALRGQNGWSIFPC